MKLMFASDIHGSLYYARDMKDKYIEEKADKLVLLGDLLYHGPRNDLPKEYNYRELINLLNGMKEELICVRGNCDSEIDQLVLDFPIMADYLTIFENDRMLFLTHGHLYNKKNMPKLKSGDILIHGHTHIQKIEQIGENICINPGSISMPKENNPCTYAIYENGKFEIKDFEGKVLNEYQMM